MRVDHLPFGPFVNASEERAFEQLSRRLRAEGGDARFVIMTNLVYSVSGGGQPDEIDMVIIGATGVHVVEVKHWDRTYIRSHQYDLEAEADKIARKARKVATNLRRRYPGLGFVAPKMLLTKEQRTLQREGDEPCRGVRLFGLTDWRNLIELDDLTRLSEAQIEEMCEEIAPRSHAVLSGELRRLGGITDLALLSSAEDRFHRVYRGRNTVNQDQVFMHLYDLSASEHAEPENLARREFQVTQRLQKSPWLPRLIDSFQPVPNYPGELFFFSLAHSSAPTLRTRAGDPAWGLQERVEFTQRCLLGLDELHHPVDDFDGVIHRSITPDAILVRLDGNPLFLQWEWARISEGQTISGPGARTPASDYAAPEILGHGLGAADRRSDVFALCASLGTLFDGDPHEQAQAALQTLSLGTAAEPDQRPNLEEIAELIKEIYQTPHSDRSSAEDGTPREVWVEDSVVTVDGHSYRVLGALGAGGTGQTFKLQQFDPDTEDEFGTYVAKLVANPSLGAVVLRSYKQARPHTKHANLARIYSTCVEWKPNTALALLEWVEGTPFGDYTGMIELYSEDLGETDPEALLLTWIADLCAALVEFHEVGLIHGDISPANIIVEGSAVTLIDYDLVTKVGEITAAAGTPPYASPTLRDRLPVTPADDLFALGATFFSVLTDRDPFVFDGIRAVDRGLAWPAGLKERFPRLARFLDHMTFPDPSLRFYDARAAITFLRELVTEEPVLEPLPASMKPLPLTPNEVPWLKEILTAYPGSRYGNIETRGLDSAFSEQTYVETGLDEWLRAEIQDGRIALVILCGNAGDGKTAFLQHLATRLGLVHFSSSQRVWDVTLANGIRVKVNLDGAAAWQGRSADELLDEIFSPFHHGRPATRIVHFVAVNDGRLMEWVSSYESRHGPTRLTEQIADRLEAGAETLDPHVCLVELNLRSLVGGFGADGQISTQFLESLFRLLVGGDNAQDVWRPCLSCSAQSHCTVRRSVRLLGVGELDAERWQGSLLRRRLADALQIVHQRNEVHITTRELKGAVSYILFGTRYCTDIHAHPDELPESPWDLAFDPSSPLRQGELLHELAKLDPALDAHPRIDRYLLGRGAPDPEHGAPRYPGLSLRSARRRAYLEWTDTQIDAVGGAPSALCVAGARHFRQFRDFPVLSVEEQAQIRRELCLGLSRLEDLPSIALKRTGVVPVRVVPRTPTETAFWVERPFDRFSLEPERAAAPPGLETLHRHLTLGYKTDRASEEGLLIPFELFSLLMDLKDGMQLIDTLSDDVFANLSVFIQRLAGEDERQLMAWNPVSEDIVYNLGTEVSELGQMISIVPIAP